MDVADSTPLPELDATLARLRAAWAANVPGYLQRRDDLRRLDAAIAAGVDAMHAAIDADFGHR